MFFKGERHAYQVYEMLEPCVSLYYDEINNKELEDGDPKCDETTKFV